MKSTIIYLGVFALTAFTSCTAKNGLKTELFSQQEIAANYMQSEQYSNLSVLEGSKNSLLEKVIATEKDTSVYEALVAFNKTYERAIEEIIAEDNLITENNDEEMYSIPSSNSNLKVILEDNKIIESDTTEEVHYLDFKIINAASNKESTIEYDIITFDKKALKS